MNIALVAPDAATHPAASSCYAVLAPALAAAGADVHLIIPAGSVPAPALEVRGRLTIHRLGQPGAPVTTPRRWLGFATASARLLHELAARRGLDVIEAPSCGGAPIAAALLGIGAERRVPIVVSIQGRAGFGESSARASAAADVAESACLRLANLVIAPTSKSAVAFGHDAESGAVAVICPNPVMVPAAVPEPAGPRRVLCLGSGHAEGVMQTLFTAWRSVSASRPEWRLAVSASRSPSTTARGADAIVSAEDPSGVERLPARADPASSAPGDFAIAVDPAPGTDGFPDACACAIAHGRPVIVPEGSPATELLGPTAPDAVFRSGDARSLASALLAITGEPRAALEARGRAARERVRSVCDPATIARSRLLLYEHAVAAVRPGISRSTQRLELWRALRDLARPEGVIVARPTHQTRAARPDRQGAAA